MSLDGKGVEFSDGLRCSWCLRGAPFEKDHSHESCPLLSTMNKIRAKAGYPDIRAGSADRFSRVDVKKAADPSAALEKVEERLKKVESRLTTVEQTLKHGPSKAEGSKKRKASDSPQGGSAKKKQNKGKGKGDAAPSNNKPSGSSPKGKGGGKGKGKGKAKN
jgi:hypothetical protein